MLYNPARKPGNDKRPRIKGRFVSKTALSNEQAYYSMAVVAAKASDSTSPVPGACAC